MAAAAHVAVAVVAAAADTEGDSAVGRVVGVQVEKAAFASLSGRVVGVQGAWWGCRAKSPERDCREPPCEEIKKKKRGYCSTRI